MITIIAIMMIIITTILIMIIVITCCHPASWPGAWHYQGRRAAWRLGSRDRTCINCCIIIICQVSQRRDVLQIVSASCQVSQRRDILQIA